MKFILDPDFEYTPSVETDIRATFERVWRELDTRNQSATSSAESPSGSLSAASSESEIALANNAKDSEVQPSSVPLTARERTIVLLMGHGLTNRMIARQLSIAPDTVKAHAKNIFWKLTVQTRAQAVYRALELGII